MGKLRRIAIAAERSSAYGRSFIRGVATVAEQHLEWDLALIDPLYALSASDEYDGWICRMINARTARALAYFGKPVVDCLCAIAEPTRYLWPRLCLERSMRAQMRQNQTTRKRARVSSAKR